MKVFRALSKCIGYFLLQLSLCSCSFIVRVIGADDSSSSPSQPAPSFSVSLMSSAPDHVMNSFVVQVQFTESVVSLSAADIEITGGTISYFTGSGSLYFFTVTPTTDVSIRLPAGKAQSVSGVANPESNLFVRYFDSSIVQVGWDTEASIKMEGNSVMADFIPVTLSSAKPYDVVLQYRILDAGATAVNPTHFDLPSLGTITIPAGSTTGQLNYNFIGDSTFTFSKMFKVVIEATNSHAVLLGRSTHQHILLEDDGGTVFTQISAGKNHTCGVTTTAALKCWGDNGNGQLGDGTTLRRKTSTWIDSGVNYQSVSAGESHTCAITAAGELKCWGNNANAQLGTGDRTSQSSPVLIDSGTSYLAVAAGAYHTCAITAAGVLKCWGNTSDGRLGDGNSASSWVTLPKTIDSGTSYLKIAAGFQHSCGITSSNDLKCWGSNGNGEIGDGTTSSRSLPSTIDSGVSFSQVRVGDSHTCAVTNAGVLKCWGSNSRGQLGDNSTTDRLLPTEIDSGTNYAELEIGDSHSCSITTGNILKCWGSNSYGQLGDGTTVDRLTPTAISSGVSFSQVAAGGSHTCALTSSGNLRCWGNGISSQLGNNLSGIQYTPVLSRTGTYATAKAGGYHVCSIDLAGTLRCWGDNWHGKIGDGTLSSRNAAVVVDPGTPYLMISVGYQNTCGITVGGALKCWGEGGNGTNGSGATSDISLPTLVDPGVIYVSVSAGGGSHACGITSTGALKCWGANWSGQLGDGTTTDSLVPLVVSPGTSYAQVSTGGAQTCAITTDGILQCWGDSWNGEVGAGSSGTEYHSPQVIDSGTSYSSVFAGGNHTCAITTAGDLKCWGNNGTGEVGDGTYVSKASPTLIDSGTKFAQVSLDWNTSYAITSDGTLKCWGKACIEGSFSTTPSVTIDPGVSYAWVGTGADHRCAIVTPSRTLRCWGSDWKGELGIGTSSQSVVPITYDY